VWQLPARIDGMRGRVGDAGTMILVDHVTVYQKAAELAAAKPAGKKLRMAAEKMQLPVS